MSVFVCVRNGDAGCRACFILCGHQYMPGTVEPWFGSLYVAQCNYNNSLMQVFILIRTVKWTVGKTLSCCAKTRCPSDRKKSKGQIWIPMSLILQPFCRHRNKFRTEGWVLSKLKPRIVGINTMKHSICFQSTPPHSHLHSPPPC